MKKVIHNSRYFELTKHNIKNPKKRGKGPRYYKISIVGNYSYHILDEVNDYLSKDYMGYKYHWLFNDLRSAQRTYTMLLMKWP